METFALSRVWHEDVRDIELRLAAENDPLGIPPLDLEWWWGRRLNAGTLGVSARRISRKEVHFVCDVDEDYMLHALEPVESFEIGPRTHMGDSGRGMTTTHALLGLLFSNKSDRFDRLEFLQALTAFNRLEVENETYSHVVCAALHARPNDFDLTMFAGHDWITRDPRFWSLLCQRLGIEPEQDTDLLVLLTQCWDEDSAFSLIPADVLDAWLRLAEGGFEVHSPAPSLHRVLKGTLGALGDSRPDLIKRADNLLAEREA